LAQSICPSFEEANMKTTQDMQNLRVWMLLVLFGVVLLTAGWLQFVTPN
jgi:hypothetical protein